MNKNISSLLLAAAGAGAVIAARTILRRVRQLDLQGKTVLVTGGSRGLGLLLARKLLAEGANVAICARDAAELSRAIVELDNHRDLFAVRCDVTDREEVERMIRMVDDHFGQIDVLINNAGVIQVGPVENMTHDDFREAMNIHFWGPLNTTLAVMPAMKRRGEGRIVNISSIGGKVAVPHLLPYCASKFALVGLSEGLRAELAKDGIIVTTVCPGLMRTGSHVNAFMKGDHRAEFTWFSIADSLPIISMAADRAADQIVAALKDGRAELILTGPAKALARVHGLHSGAIADVLGVVNMLLPAPTADPDTRWTGAESESDLSPSFLTESIDQAMIENNERAVAS
ncbi:MAG: gno 2 [Chlorobi bacterium]|nr:gno 2 [Chlorobiota bacterium]